MLCKMSSFDQIIPFDNLGLEVGGYITALNEDFYIHLINKNTSPREVQLRGCPKLLKILQPVLLDLEKHLKLCTNITEMLKEIQNTLEHQIRLSGKNQSANYFTECNVLFEQLQNCGWEKINFISPDFGELHLKTADGYSREHILKIWIPEKFPYDGPKYECDLPEEFQYRWLPDDCIANMFTAFQEALIRYSEFWNNMDEIDQNTWVLEPEKPTRKDCKRRIALASGVSLLLVINPDLPTAIPTCLDFIGPERSIEPVRKKFNKNILRWSEYESVLTNLQQVLEMDFPSPTTTVKEDFCMECGICYSYQLDENIPNMSCENPNCSQTFHHSCLYEYIRMLPDVRTSFNKLFGQCPYCSKPLWCTIP